MDIDVSDCARCGQDHTLSFDKLTQPSQEWSHWAMCPATEEPVWLASFTGQDKHIMEGERFRMSLSGPTILEIDGLTLGMCNTASIRMTRNGRSMVIGRRGLQVHRPVAFDPELDEEDGVLLLTGRFLD